MFFGPKREINKMDTCSALLLGQPDSLPRENLRLLATAMKVDRLFSSEMMS
jgi:hypothetical protein